MLISTVWTEQKPALTAILLTVLALMAAPGLLGEPLLLTLITVLMYATLTLAWTMFSGPTGNVSLATGALFGVGVYVAALLRDRLPLELLMVAGGLVAFALALAIGVLTLRLRGVYFILFTFGVTALVRNLVHWLETHVTGTVGRHVDGASTEVVYLLVAILFAVTLAGAFLLRHSSTGLALEGIGGNQDAAAHVGVPVALIKVAVFAGSSAIIGATGAVMATRWRYIDPAIAFNPMLSFLPVVMAIFGGTSRLYGPLLGTAVLVVLREVLVTQSPYLYPLLFGLTLLVVVLWLPDGLVSLPRRWMQRTRTGVEAS